MMLLMIIVSLILLSTVFIMAAYFRLEIKDKTALAEKNASEAHQAKQELIGRDEIIENYEQDFLSKDERIDGLTKSVVDLEDAIDGLKLVESAHQETIEALHRLLDVSQRMIEEQSLNLSAREETVLFHTNNCLPVLERIRAGIE